jgi:DNA repair protein RadD
MNPRPYQAAALRAIPAWFAAHDDNPLIVIPTGGGKSPIIAWFIESVLKQWPGQRILCLTHVKELIVQNYDKMMSVWPDAPAGIYSASVGRRDIFEPVIFAGIQSVHKKPRMLGAFDLVIIDEAHLINHRAEGMYRRFLSDAKAMNPALKCIGFTATPFRTNHGDITKSRPGENDEPIFGGVAYEIGILDLIDQGYLCPVVPKQTDAQIDLSSVHVRGGEFVQSELQRATDQDDLTRAAVSEIVALGSDRKSWLIFCTGIDHSYHVRDALRDAGIEAETITSRTPSNERDQLVEDYKSGKIRALTNAEVLTTGFDAPETDLIAFLRATHSPVLYLQMVGRGTRLAPDKPNCLILDFAGNAMRHGPIDQIKAWNPAKKRPQAAPQKTCPECSTIHATAVRQCPCGYEFEFEERAQHEARAASVALLSNQVERQPPTRHEVTQVIYRRHVKRHSESPPTLRVDYVCGMRRFSEWVCLEHPPGFARSKAHAWWRERFYMRETVGPPETVGRALIECDYLKTPTAIWVDENSQYPRITRYEWSSSKPQPQPQAAEPESKSRDDGNIETGAGHRNRVASGDSMH